MKCKTCEHGIFDPNYGEWKCKNNPNRVYTEEEVEWCRKFKKKSKTKK